MCLRHIEMDQMKNKKKTEENLYARRLTGHDDWFVYVIWNRPNIVCRLNCTNRLTPINGIIGFSFLTKIGCHLRTGRSFPSLSHTCIFRLCHSVSQMNYLADNMNCITHNGIIIASNQRRIQYSNKRYDTLE